MQQEICARDTFVSVRQDRYGKHQLLSDYSKQPALLIMHQTAPSTMGTPAHLFWLGPDYHVVTAKLSLHRRANDGGALVEGDQTSVVSK